MVCYGYPVLVGRRIAGMLPIRPSQVLSPAPPQSTVLPLRHTQVTIKTKNDGGQLVHIRPSLSCYPRTLTRTPTQKRLRTMLTAPGSAAPLATSARAQPSTAARSASLFAWRSARTAASASLASLVTLPCCAGWGQRKEERYRREGLHSQVGWS